MCAELYDAVKLQDLRPRAHPHAGSLESSTVWQVQQQIRLLCTHLKSDSLPTYLAQPTVFLIVVLCTRLLPKAVISGRLPCNPDYPQLFLSLTLVGLSLGMLWKFLT